jgi:hypothetical protein
MFHGKIPAIGSISHAGGKNSSFKGDKTGGSGIATKLAQQSVKGAGVMHGVSVCPGTKVEDRFISIFIFDLHKFVDDRFQRLFPGNPCECAGPSFPCPLERIEQPVRGIYTLTVGVAPSTHAGSALSIIGFNANHPAAFNVHPHFAEAAAVAVTDTADNMFLAGLALAHGNVPLAFLIYFILAK